MATGDTRLIMGPAAYRPRLYCTGPHWPRVLKRELQPFPVSIFCDALLLFWSLLSCLQSSCKHGKFILQASVASDFNGNCGWMRSCKCASMRPWEMWIRTAMDRKCGHGPQWSCGTGSQWEVWSRAPLESVFPSRNGTARNGKCGHGP